MGASNGKLTRVAKDDGVQERGGTIQLLGRSSNRCRVPSNGTMSVYFVDPSRSGGRFGNDQTVVAADNVLMFDDFDRDAVLPNDCKDNCVTARAVSVRDLGLWACRIVSCAATGEVNAAQRAIDEGADGPFIAALAVHGRHSEEGLWVDIIGGCAGVVEETADGCVCTLARDGFEVRHTSCGPLNTGVAQPSDND
ncbi:MAG: hypothetical protein ACJATT_001404 [Myxococcota bacterium]|jgi:hypothetical protein